MENKLRLLEATYNIQINSEESYNVACWIGRCLKQTVKDHWVNHPNCDYKKEESELIRIMKFYFSLSAFPDYFTQIIDDCDKIIHDSKLK
jgi:hypothetical protein